MSSGINAVAWFAGQSFHQERPNNVTTKDTAPTRKPSRTIDEQIAALEAKKRYARAHAEYRGCEERLRLHIRARDWDMALATTKTMAELIVVMSAPGEQHDNA